MGDYYPYAEVSKRPNLRLGCSNHSHLSTPLRLPRLSGESNLRRAVGEAAACLLGAELTDALRVLVLETEKFL